MNKGLYEAEKNIEKRTTKGQGKEDVIQKLLIIWTWMEDSELNRMGKRNRVFPGKPMV